MKDKQSERGQPCKTCGFERDQHTDRNGCGEYTQPETEQGVRAALAQDINAICDKCGAPIRDHMIGGPAPYHPKPVATPLPSEGAVAWREIAKQIKTSHTRTQYAQILWDNEETILQALLASPPPASGPSDSAVVKGLKEVRLLVTEYDKENSDWIFRRRVLLTCIDAALSAASPASAEVRSTTIEECAKAIADLRQREAGLTDSLHTGLAGASRSDALHDAHTAVRALASGEKREET